MSRTWFMLARARAIVQQGGAGGGAAPAVFSFTDPTFNNGIVYAIIDDGSGGKFVGGTFTSVTCTVTSTTYTTGYERLIHLLPTGEVDAAWSCPVGSSQVRALALDVANDVLYVGGSFSTIGGESRLDLAAVTASTGVVDAGWTCDITGDCRSLALDVANDVLYVGGSFTAIGGSSKADIAAVTASTGVVDAGWTCDTNGYVQVLALDVANDVLYVGGAFTSLGGVSRTNIAAVTASTGVVDTGWTCNVTGNSVESLALDVTNDVLYLGGRFTIVGGSSRSGLAAVTASSGTTVSGWVCNLASSTQNVYALAVDSSADRLYVGGTFTNLDSASPAKLRLAAVTASTGDVDAAWQCDAGGTVFALQVDPANNALFVGGGFFGATGLDGEQRDRFGTVVASTGDLFVP